MPPITDHPLRYALANELHARPCPSLAAPCTAASLAVPPPGHSAARDRDADMRHLIALLDRHGAPHPQPGATHYSGKLGRYTLKWESHTEFVTYTAFGDGLSARPFDPMDFDVFPADWLAQLDGQRITSALIRVENWTDKDKVGQALNDWFVPESLAVSRVLDDAAVVGADFRIDAGGHQRFAVFVAPGTGRRRIGRIVQRLCEIETYKSVSMLGFAAVKDMSAKMTEIDQRLTQVMGDMSGGDQPADETLGKLLSVSAELEAMIAHSAFRFGATGAYEAIVNQRIEVLREQRFDGRQTFAEFMMRRYDPAMRTVKAAERRLAAMSERAMRAGNLLRTRVDVERSAQNQALLESMNSRADAQLKLQRTVEGLSVVAISYYAVSLLSYLVYPVSDLTGLSKGTLLALLTLPVVLMVWVLLRRIQKALH